MGKTAIDLERENEQLKIAISHVNMAIFEYDFLTKQLEFYEETIPPLGLPQMVENGVDFIVTCGVLDEENAFKFKSLFDEMEKGNLFASDRIMPNSYQQICYNVMLTNCFDEYGIPIRVVGTFHDVTDRAMTEINYFKEEQFRLAMLADSRKVYEINITKNRLMTLKSIKDSTDDESGWVEYTSAMETIKQNAIYQEDWEEFSEVADRDNLMYCFANGKTEFYCEYRRIDTEGKLIWVSSTTHILRDPVTSDIKAFTYVKDIDTEKKQQMIMMQQVQEDHLTGIFNRATGVKKIEKILDNPEEDTIHGFLSIDIDEFKTVNDTFGHLKGDFLLQKIAEGFKSVVRKRDVLARMGGDEFIVFLNDVKDKEQIKFIANRLRKHASTIVIDENVKFESTISIGIAVFPDDGLTFEKLYMNSDSALYHAKHHGKNRVAVFGE